MLFIMKSRITNDSYAHGEVWRKGMGLLALKRCMTGRLAIALMFDFAF